MRHPTLPMLAERVDGACHITDAGQEVGGPCHNTYAAVWTWGQGQSLGLWAQ